LEQEDSVTELGKFIISDLLERKALLEEKARGFGLADYLLKTK
jgi:hypothetical protein